MAACVNLPPIEVTATADPTGNNAGNYTAILSTSSMSLSYLTKFECYKITVDGPVGFGVSVYIDNRKWDHTAQGWQNAWDANQVMPLQAGQTIYLYWEAPSSGTPVPTATFWFRYDTSAPQAG
jgi:hypothetical protein